MTRLPDAFDMSEMEPLRIVGSLPVRGFVREVPLAFPEPHHYDLNQMLVNFEFWLWGPVSAYLLPEQLDEQVPTLPALTTRNMGNAMAYKLVSLPH